MATNALNDNLRAETSKHLDEKYGVYQDVATALSSVRSFERVKGLTVGVDTPEGVKEYWFKAGVGENDLVEKINGSPEYWKLSNVVDLVYNDGSVGIGYAEGENLPKDLSVRGEAYIRDRLSIGDNIDSWLEDQLDGLDVGVSGSVHSRFLDTGDFSVLSGSVIASDLSGGESPLAVDSSGKLIKMTLGAGLNFNAGELSLDSSVLSQLERKGLWDAATNTPAIPAASSSNDGHFYIVQNQIAAGHGYANIPNVEYKAGDWLLSNGTSWERVKNSAATNWVQNGNNVEYSGGDVYAFENLHLGEYLYHSGELGNSIRFIAGEQEFRINNSLVQKFTATQGFIYLDTYINGSSGQTYLRGASITLNNDLASSSSSIIFRDSNGLDWTIGSGIVSNGNFSFVESSIEKIGFNASSLTINLATQINSTLDMNDAINFVNGSRGVLTYNSSNFFIRAASGQSLDLGANGVNSGIRLDTNLNASFFKTIVSNTDSTGTDGTVILEQNYSGSGVLATIGAMASSGGIMLGYAVRPKPLTGGEFVSSSGLGLDRSALALNGNQLQFWSNPTNGVVVTEGSDVSLSNVFSVDKDGNLTISSVSYALGGNSNEWNLAYDRSLIGVSFNVSNGEITLSKQDGTSFIQGLDGRYALISSLNNVAYTNVDNEFSVNQTINGNFVVNQSISNQVVSKFIGSISASPVGTIQNRIISNQAESAYISANISEGSGGNSAIIFSNNYELRLRSGGANGITLTSSSIVNDLDTTIDGDIFANNLNISNWDAAYSFTSGFNISSYYPTLDGRYLMSADLSGYALESWVNSNYLSLSGGNLTGQMSITEDVNDNLYTLDIRNPNAGVDAGATIRFQANGNNFNITTWGDGSSYANRTEFQTTAGGGRFDFRADNGHFFGHDSTENFSFSITDTLISANEIIRIITSNVQPLEVESTASSVYQIFRNTSGIVGYIGSANGLISGGLSATDMTVRSNGGILYFTTNGGSQRGQFNSSGLLISGEISTGLGYTNIYQMNQNVRSTDSITFNNGTFTGWLNVTGTEGFTIGEVTGNNRIKYSGEFRFLNSSNGWAGIQSGSITVKGNATINGDLTIPQYIHHDSDNSYFGFQSNDTFWIGLSGSAFYTFETTQFRSYAPVKFDSSLIVDGSASFGDGISVTDTVTNVIRWSRNTGVEGVLYSDGGGVAMTTNSGFFDETLYLNPLGSKTQMYAGGSIIQEWTSSNTTINGNVSSRIITITTSSVEPLSLNSTGSSVYQRFNNSSGIAGYVGSGNGLISGYGVSDFAVRAQGTYIVFGTNGNNYRARISSNGFELNSGVYTGNGSGLTNIDATTLGGLSASQFLRSDLDNERFQVNQNAQSTLELLNSTNGSNASIHILMNASGNNLQFESFSDGHGTFGSNYNRIGSSAGGSILKFMTGNEFRFGNTSTDWHSMDVNGLTIGGVINATGGNSTEWNTGYDRSPTSLSFNASTGVLSLNRQSAGALTVDLDGRYATENNYASSLSFNTSTGILTVNRSGLSSLTVDLDGRYALTSSVAGSTYYDTTAYNTTQGSTHNVRTSSISLTSGVTYEFIFHGICQTNSTWTVRFAISTSSTKSGISSGNFLAINERVEDNVFTLEKMTKTGRIKFTPTTNMTVYAYMYPISGISGLSNIVLAEYDDQSIGGAVQTQKSYVIVREV